MWAEGCVCMLCVVVVVLVNDEKSSDSVQLNFFFEWTREIATGQSVRQRAITTGAGSSEMVAEVEISGHVNVG